MGVTEAEYDRRLALAAIAYSMRNLQLVRLASSALTET